jgi:DNA modification methylase
MVPDSVLVEGSDDPDTKHDAIRRFRAGEVRVLITKPRIAGFGLNLQNCSRMAFVGINDSFEQFYQCVRRCWRFGQSQPVTVKVIVSRPEVAIFQNVMQKHDRAMESSRELVKHVAEFERNELGEKMDRFGYKTADAEGGMWKLMLGDSCERLAEVPDQSVHLSVFSPPFQSLYTYSPTERDLGNSADPETFWGHFAYIQDHLLRAMKPGRNVCVHVANLTSSKASDGFIGIKDFRGDTIRAFQGKGFIYHGEVCIDKNPQAQAIRTHAKGLLFVQKGKDSTWLRPALADYILIFRVPGENETPVIPDVSNEEWILWAHPIWYDIRETDTLNAAEGRGAEDERHICPLQLPVIERCIRLWTNPGETVLSPFAGIGSEGHEAVRLGRRFVGVELKPEYFSAATKNLKRADVQQGLFA